MASTKKIGRAWFILGGMLFLLIAIAAAKAQTQSTVYCDENPLVPDCICRSADGQIIEDYDYKSDWMSTYCAGNGMLQQKRTALQIEKPGCVERTEVMLYQLVPQDYCKKCPPPKIVSSWTPYGCAGARTIVQRQVLAYYYTPTVDECEIGRFVETKVETPGVCSTILGAPLLWVSSNWLVVLGIIVVAIIATIYAIKKWR